jgi:hypothetical protein
MKTALRTEITVKDICDGFVYNELEGKGLFGLSGKAAAAKYYKIFYSEFNPAFCQYNVICRAFSLFVSFRPVMYFAKHFTIFYISCSSFTPS